MHTFILRITIIIGVTFLVTGTSWAGSIDPNLSAVDGSGNPQSTTQIPPAWSQTLPCPGPPYNPATCVRFEVVLGGVAVVDKETGLVWQKTPDTGGRTQAVHTGYCYQRGTGGVFGWRSPTIDELSSLILSDKRPPAGHPFDSIEGGSFWSSTSCAFCEVPEGWFVGIGPTTQDGGGVRRQNKTAAFRSWCVRGHGGIGVE